MKFTQVICLIVMTAGMASASDTIETTICDVLNRPHQYAGRNVRFVGERTRPPRGVLVDDPSGRCGPILIELPTDPDVRPKAHFSVVSDAELKKFLESAFVLIPNAKTHKRGLIRARLQGRLDVAPPGKGFGHGQMYDMRLVLQQVSDVSVRDSDGKTCD